MRKFNKINMLMLIPGFVCATVMASSADHHEGEGMPEGMPEGEHDGPPPVVMLTPPEGTEKPEHVEMTGDPEHDWPVILETFHSMMDSDGSGELSLEELASWAHPGHGPGPGPGGDMPDMEEMRHQIEEEFRHHMHMERRHEDMERHREHLEHMRHEIEEARGHEERLREEAREVKEHLANMAEELRRGEEELAHEEEEGGGEPE